MEIARFLVPVKDGRPDIRAKMVRIIDAEVHGNYAEVIVDASSARYLRKRRYAYEIALPKSHISITQVNTYLRCPLQYYWRYEEGLKVPPPSAITFGLATHKAIEHNYRHKMSTHEDLPVEQVQEVWADEFDKLAPETAWEDGESPGQVKDEGIRVTGVYMSEIAPKVQPILVEEPFEIELENVEFTLKGIVDIVDDTGNIIDTKTTKRSPSEDTIARDLQMTTYALGHRTIYGVQESGLRMDFLVRNKAPKVVSLAAGPRDQREIDRLLKLIGYVARAIRDRLYYPQPHNFTCTPSGCGYYQICQERW